MKKPDEKKTSNDSKSAEPDKTGAAKPEKPAKASADPGKKPAAAPGTLASVATGPGTGTGAADSGGAVEPVESTLVGSARKGRPPASAKPASAKAEATSAAAAASTAQAGDDAGMISPTSPDAAAKPAASADMAGPKGPLKDAPAEAILRDTPAGTPAPVQNVTVRKTGFWPVALGGAVAAGLGAAATIWALPHLPAGWLPPAPVVETAPAVDAEAIRADAVSAAEAAVRDAAQVAARTEIDALLTEIAGQPFAETDTPAREDTSAAREAIASLEARIDEQAARIEELSARPSLDPEVADRVQSLADQAAALEQQIQSAAESAQTDISAAQAEAQKLQDAAEESTRRAEAVAAIASLQTALDRGVTPDEARQTLEDAGLDAPEALTREVPSLESLQAGFGEAARSALRAALREDSAGGGNVLTNFLRAQTGARSVTPREGDDPDAILSRADAEVEAGRIAPALELIAALPDPARGAPAMAAWIEGATAYRDAQTALSDLSANSN